jgi:hypothetical protein
MRVEVTWVRHKHSACLTPFLFLRNRTKVEVAWGGNHVTGRTRRFIANFEGIDGDWSRSDDCCDCLKVDGRMHEISTQAPLVLVVSWSKRHFGLAMGDFMRSFHPLDKRQWCRSLMYTVGTCEIKEMETERSTCSRHLHLQMSKHLHVFARSQQHVMTGVVCISMIS